MKGKPAFEFVAYFSALNALYWLWALRDSDVAFTPEESRQVADALPLASVPKLSPERVVARLSGLRNEGVLIDHLIDRLPDEDCNRLAARNAGFARFLKDRGPIYRMDKRSLENSIGDVTEGKKLLAKLSDPRADGKKRVKAMARILYLVRCNLVHGSKMADAQDADLLEQCVPPLRDITSAAIALTEAPTL